MSLTTLLYPELRGVVPAQRAPLVRRARRNPFDVLELLAMAGAMVMAAWLVQAAAPLLAPVVVAALFAACEVRRTRRALRDLLGAP